MRTQVFAYKGLLGILSDVKAEGLLNDPSKPGQLGFVADAKAVDIDPAALELLKTIKSSGDDIGDVDVFASANGVVFAWLGGPKKLVDPATAEGSNSYDADLLTKTANIVAVPAPDDFKAIVNKQQKAPRKTKKSA